MKIEHLAIWVNDLGGMKDFYMKYFQATVGPLYANPKKHFTSYFLSFKDSGFRLELMHNPHIAKPLTDRGHQEGLAHFAISVGSKNQVDTLTETLRKDQFKVIGEPRTTGDGYYESVVLDPEGNYLELTV